MAVGVGKKDKYYPAVTGVYNVMLETKDVNSKGQTWYYDDIDDTIHNVL